MPTRCNNCSQHHGIFGDHCLLQVLLGMEVAMGHLTNQEARELIAKVAVVPLWDDVSPILKKLSDGHYNYEEDET